MSQVVDNSAQQRYELAVDGLLAIAQYRIEGAKIYITHVEVPPALRGGGVAATLMQGVVADIVQRGLEVVPICSYAALYLRRNPL